MAKKGDLALVRIQASGVMYQNPYRYVPGKIGYRFAIVDAASRDGDVKKVWGRKDLTAVYTRSASTIGNVATCPAVESSVIPKYPCRAFLLRSRIP